MVHPARSLRLGIGGTSPQKKIQTSAYRKGALSMMRTLAVAFMSAMFLLGAGSSAFAKNDKVSAKKHINLANAQKAMEQAVKWMTKAQEANEYELGGHGAKAKELL